MSKLYDQKREMKKDWEKCFGIELEEKLNEKGINKFWSDETSEKEALDLLTAAGTDYLIEEIIDGAIKSGMIDIDDEDEGPIVLKVEVSRKKND